MVGTKMFSITTWHRSFHSTLEGLRAGWGVVGLVAKGAGEGGEVTVGERRYADADRVGADKRAFHNSIILFENHLIPY